MKGLIPAKKGEIRNPTGANGYTSGTGSLTRMLKKRLEGKAEKIIDRLLELAEEGELAAIKEVFDRDEGKPRQRMEIAGPAEITVTRKGEKTTIKLKPDDNGQDGNGHE